MSVDIRRVKDMNGLITYLAEKLSWRIDLDDFEDIEDIAYDFEAEDIGLKEEAFVKIQSLRQLPPLVDGQKWGIFCVEFDSKRFEVTALRKILSGLIPKRRNSADHAVWDQKDLLFICFWGSDNERTIGLAHFEDAGSGLPQIKMISCCPSVEDFTQISVFEDRLKSLKWPANYVDHDRWQRDWSSAFTTGYKQTIRDASTLTVQLAIEAQGIKKRILDVLAVETANGYVHLLYEKFKNTLIHDMTETQFADMYAQTVVYGLFSARCMDETQEDFSAAEAVDCIPNTNPFLKSLMKECLGSQNNSKLSFDELEIGNVVDLLRNTKTDLIIQDFNRQTGGGREDPVIHFYEEFLDTYDKMQKVQRGVFYTPQPVVNFIVNAIDSIIRNEFGYEDGLASVETKRLKVYLTNALEEPGNDSGQMTLFEDPLAVESIEANKVKKNAGVNIVLGNPPYAAASANKGEWIMDLMEAYKKEPGGVIKLNERNPKWLNDDYVKFIRLSEEYVGRGKQGILAFINPHGFIDNPTFRGMRWHLLQTFDKIYVLDLHGNSNRKEKCPDGSKDENVFDIQQGVSINIFVKYMNSRTSMAEVYHADLWGTRENKYSFLLEKQLSDINFKKVTVVEPEYNFTPTNLDARRKYNDGFAVDELFKNYSVGVVTAKDKVLIASSKQALLSQVKSYYGIEPDMSKVRPIYYRPLDKQFIYYDSQVHICV